MCISLTLYCTQTSVIKYMHVHDHVLPSFSTVSTAILVTIIALPCLTVVGILVAIAMIFYLRKKGMYFEVLWGESEKKS